MRLKSIKLVGFKSFVDSTVVPFPSNMTAIVGPNGCGKSNVIDAVRWVMGESSAKYLRGESMTDVIFNGSTHRQPVGQASIELLFDNSEGKLTGEHAAFTEISIKRKVTREGVSQYFLNGTKCRRRDVTDIFLGTGMGPRSYAIIEQGMISRLIESKPEELRVYLEEAAGISKYKERRRETENRMRRTSENLERLSDIREELGKQLATLKRQANAAEKFKEYKAQERKLSALLATVHWAALDAQREAFTNELQELEQRVEMLVLDKATGQSKIEAVRAELEEALASFQTLQGKYYQTGAAIAKLEQEIKFEREKAQRSAEDKARVSDDLSRAEERSLLLKEELAERAVELDELLPEIEMLHEGQALQLEQVQVAEERFQTWLQKNETVQEHYASARRESDALQSKVSRSETLIQSTNDRLLRLSQERESLNEQAIEGQNLERNDHFKTLSCERDDTEAELSELAECFAQTEAEYESAVVLRDTVKAELSNASAILTSLKTVQDEAKSSMTQSEAFNRFADAHGFDLLFERLTVSDGWAEIVEQVLGRFLYARVVAGSTIADFDWLAHGGREFSLYQRDGDAQIPVEGTLACMVSGFDPINDLLNKVCVAESIEGALGMRDALHEGQMVATQDGYLVSKSWVRALATSAEGDSVVARQNRIDTLSRDHEALVVRASSLEADCASKLERKQTLSKTLKARTQVFSDLSKECNRLASDISADEARQEQYLIRIARCDEELLSLRESVEHESAELEALKIDWEQSISLVEELSERRLAHGDQRDMLRDAIELARDVQRDTQSKLHALTLSQQKTADRVDVLKQSEAELELSIADLRAKLLELVEVGTDLERVESLTASLQDLLVTHEREEKRLAEACGVQEVLQKSLREGELLRDKSESALADQRAALEQLRLKQQALLMEQSHQLERVGEDGFQLEPLLDELAEEPRDEAELNDALHKVAQRVQRLGPINLAAVDEYETQSERKNYLDAQDEELQEALNTLTNAIRKIDKETRTRFKETYDRVNAGLQDLFPKIFGGGSAKLELTDSDLLETGVTIMARPPGKNNSTIHLLSGGEKALTALALIFSIFKLNPAPFCMLDEVDAPLDDANVGRFARLVKEMSATVQFIYISHNKVSMEMADQLMGVTMHEPGVSRLVSVDIEAAAQLAEA